MADPSIRGGDYRSGWAPPRLPQVGLDTKSQALQQTLTHLNSWTNNFSDAVVNDLDDLAFITEKFTENADGTVSISDPLRLPDRKLYFSEYGVSNNDFIEFNETNNAYMFYADSNMIHRVPDKSLVGIWSSGTNATVTSGTAIDFGSPYSALVTKPTGWNSYDLQIHGHATVTLNTQVNEWTRVNILSRVGGATGLSQSVTFVSLSDGGFRFSVPIAQRVEGITGDITVALQGYRGKGASGTGPTIENSLCFGYKTWKS